MGETLATHRCPVCGWVGEADGGACPRECGSLLVEYRIELAED
jgi:predicted nucleic acid-binding Zn ribbon protein